jgi:lipase chaperone LimK
MMNLSTTGDELKVFYVRKYIPDVSGINEEPLSNDELIIAQTILKELKHNEHLTSHLVEG